MDGEKQVLLQDEILAPEPQITPIVPPPISSHPPQQTSEHHPKHLDELLAVDVSTLYDPVLLDIADPNMTAATVIDAHHREDEAAVAAAAAAASLRRSSSSSAAEVSTPTTITRTLNMNHVYLVLVCAMLNGIALAMIIPVLPNLLLISVGKDSSRAAYITGLISFSGSCIEIISNPLLGAVSDKIGRKPILMLAMTGLIVEMGLIAMFWKSTMIFILARVTASITGVFFTTLNIILADLSAHTGREAEVFGKSGAAYGIAFLVGPLIGGILERFKLSLAVYVSTFLMIANLFYIGYILPETCINVISASTSRVGEDSVLSRVKSFSIKSVSINPIPSAARLFQDPILSWLALSFMVDGLAVGGLQSIFFLYVNLKFQWTSEQVGYFFSAHGLSLIISQGYLVGIYKQHFQEANIVVFGYLAEVLHFVIYAVSTSGSGMYLGLLTQMVGNCGPILKGIIVRQVDLTEQGNVQGSLMALQTLARPIAPLLGNFLFAYFTASQSGLSSQAYYPGAPMFFFAGISCIALLIATKALYHPNLKK